MEVKKRRYSFLKQIIMSAAGCEERHDSPVMTSRTGTIDSPG